MIGRFPRRRFVAAAAVVLLQLTSIASASTSVIWCIGDGHAGVETQRAGEDCASCCHEEDSGEAGASECTDVSLHSSDAVTCKVTADPPAAAFVAVAFTPVRIPVSTFLPRTVCPPRLSTVERQSTVLRI